MPKPQHTPRPWNYGQDKMGRWRVFAAGWEIVRAMAAHGGRRLTREEREANARLIAAAPDMLAALMAMVVQAESGIRFATEDLRAARIAIAKAGG